MDLTDAIAACESNSWEARAQAAAQLGRAYRPDVDALVRKLLVDDDIGVVEAAAEALVFNGSNDAVRVLLAAIAKAGDDEQLNQAYFWSMFPDVPVAADVPIRPALVQALSDGDPEVQEGARVALAWAEEES